MNAECDYNDDDNYDHNCGGDCIVDVDCTGECGGSIIATFPCNNSFVCSPSDCIDLNNDLDMPLYSVPDKLGLNRIYPNPFNPVTEIEYDIVEYSMVVIRVFDIQGREVSELINANQSPGQYHLMWNASTYSSGMYFVQMIVKTGDAGIFRDMRKLLYMK